MPEKKGPEAKLQAVTELADIIAEQVGVRVVDIKFGQQGKKKTLEVTIFRPEGQVSHDDCEKLSRLLDEAIEQQATTGPPVVDGLYMLEVQSPGIDRPLKSEREFRIFAGHRVQIETKEKVQDLGHNVIGVLVGLVDGQVKVANAEALPTGTSKTGKKPSKISGSKETSQNDKKDNGKESEATLNVAQDVSIEQKKITQIKLYAPELAPKSNPKSK